MKVTVIPIVIGALGTVTKWLEELEIRARVETIENYSIIKNWESPWDLRRHAVTQTSVEDHRIALV